MIVCIAGYENRVATLYEHAQELLFYKSEDSGMRMAARIATPPGGPSCWTDLLRERGTQLLICGGLCRHTQRLLLSADIDVTPWICGSVDAVLDALQRESLSECLMPGASRRRDGLGGQGGCRNGPGPRGRLPKNSDLE